MVFQTNPSRHPHDGTLERMSAFASPDVAQHWATGLRRFHATVGRSGSITLVCGAILAVACTASAVALDVPYQVALLAGYITVAASVGICAALVAVRHSPPGTESGSTLKNSAPKVSAPKTSTFKTSMSESATSESATSETSTSETSTPKAVTNKVAKRKASEPDYAAWTRASKLRVADASRLWCGIEPGHPATDEVIARAAAILDAVERDELQKSDNGALARYKIGWHTEIERGALQAWARSKGDAPRFLCD